MEQMTENQRKQFGECLAHYAQREPKHFVQLDCRYMPDDGDDVMHMDENGDCATVSNTVELMRGATVRVLIPHDTDPVIAARQLKRLAKWLNREPMLMKKMMAQRVECERKSREKEELWPF